MKPRTGLTESEEDKKMEADLDKFAKVVIDHRYEE